MLTENTAGYGIGYAVRNAAGYTLPGVSRPTPGPRVGAAWPTRVHSEVRSGSRTGCTRVGRADAARVHPAAVRLCFAPVRPDALEGRPAPRQAASRFPEGSTSRGEGSEGSAFLSPGTFGTLPEPSATARRPPVGSAGAPRGCIPTRAAYPSAPVQGLRPQRRVHPDSRIRAHSGRPRAALAGCTRAARFVPEAHPNRPHGNAPGNAHRAPRNARRNTPGYAFPTPPKNLPLLFRRSIWRPA